MTRKLGISGIIVLSATPPPAPASMPRISWQLKKKKACPETAGWTNSKTIIEYVAALGKHWRHLCLNKFQNPVIAGAVFLLPLMMKLRPWPWRGCSCGGSSLFLHRIANANDANNATIHGTKAAEIASDEDIAKRW